VRAYDAAVIGGGPAGTSTAILLARRGWSVLLLERKTFPRRKVCGEYLSATNLPLLRHLGVAEVFHESAGPDVRRVGLFAGTTTLSADLPPLPGHNPWGRALGREHLDTLLLERAVRAGVEVLQPWSATELVRLGAVFHGRARAAAGEERDFRARVVVAAHGSWDAGPLPTQPARPPASPSDLLGFKAHFRAGRLAPGLMPLLAFPGGYGGMVHTDGDRISLSCCVRRDRLASLRTGSGRTAGEDVGAYIATCCRGVREALDGATLDGPWLAAGPLRPGMRLGAPPGSFPVGNCAGEAHPVIAEGISMALQSGWLLAECLDAWRRQGARPAALSAVGYAYARTWRRHFAARLRASAVVAHWAMSPAAVAVVLPLLRLFPGLLTWGARVSGKTHRVLAQGQWRPAEAPGPLTSDPFPRKVPLP
jgi:flavin-dependent dehydrogenase